MSDPLKDDLDYQRHCEAEVESDQDDEGDE